MFSVLLSNFVSTCRQIIAYSAFLNESFGPQNYAAQPGRVLLYITWWGGSDSSIICTTSRGWSGWCWHHKVGCIPLGSRVLNLFSIHLQKVTVISPVYRTLGSLHHIGPLVRYVNDLPLICPVGLFSGAQSGPCRHVSVLVGLMPEFSGHNNASVCMTQLFSASTTSSLFGDTDIGLLASGSVVRRLLCISNWLGKYPHSSGVSR